MLAKISVILEEILLWIKEWWHAKQTREWHSTWKPSQPGGLSSSSCTLIKWIQCGLFGVHRKEPGHGLDCHYAVMSLLNSKVLDSRYHLYMNNFYTHSKLLTDLFVMKFGACGTYMDSRRVFPQNANNSQKKIYQRIHQVQIQDGPLVFVKWMDTWEVSVCSTIHVAFTGDTVQRRVEAEVTRRTIFSHVLHLWLHTPTHVALLTC